MNFYNNFFRSKVFDKLNSFVIKKIFKIFKIFFVEANLTTIPKSNYPLKNIDEELNSSKYYNDNNIRPYISYSHLPDLCEIIHNQNQKLVFFDFGAGNLNLFYYLNKKFENVEYFFKDQKPIEEKVKNIVVNNKIKNLHIDKDLTNQGIDLVYFGSSIQYIDNYKDKLKSLFGKTKYILIAQTPFFENIKLNETIVLKQLNMHPNINYLYLFNFYFFLEFIKENNYFLVEKNINKVTKFLNFRNFDKTKYKDLNMYDLLFKYKK